MYTTYVVGFAGGTRKRAGEWELEALIHEVRCWAVGMSQVEGEGGILGKLPFSQPPGYVS